MYYSFFVKMKSKMKLAPHEDAVVTRAAQRAAHALGLNQRELGEVLGVSEAKVSRLGSESWLVSGRKEFELAIQFLRLFRSLDALVGGDEQKARAWMHADNHYLGGVPAELVKSIPGLMGVVEYLDAMRGQI
jgi:hypothetical protein